MPGPLKTEAIVLRSIRYGEADRILHLYTPGYGRLSAIAKGARRSRSRFGARLEPFFHVRAMLHEGRSDLLTVTGVDTIAVHAAVRDHAVTLDAASQGVRRRLAVVRDLRSPPRRISPARQRTGLLQSDVAHARPGTGLAFRLKLLLAAGIVPQLAACAVCGETDHLQGFSGAAGGVVCSTCEAAAFPCTRMPTASWSTRWARLWPEAPDGSERVLRQVERAIGETAEHHAQVRLRPLAGARA